MALSSEPHSSRCSWFGPCQAGSEVTVPPLWISHLLDRIWGTKRVWLGGVLAQMEDNWLGLHRDSSHSVGSYLLHLSSGQQQKLLYRFHTQKTRRYSLLPLMFKHYLNELAFCILFALLLFVTKYDEIFFSDSHETCQNHVPESIISQHFKELGQ